MNAFARRTRDPANDLAGLVGDGQDDLGLVLGLFLPELVPAGEGDGLPGLVEFFLHLAPGLGPGLQRVLQIIGEHGAEGRVGRQVERLAQAAFPARIQRPERDVHQGFLTGKRIASLSSACSSIRLKGE